MTAPDFPPEVIEKAARALFNATFPGDYASDPNWYEAQDQDWFALARAVLDVVADPLRAEGAEGDQHWMKQEYDRAREQNALIPPHARMVVTNPELSAHSRNTAPVKAEAATYQRGMAEGARQVLAAVEDTWGPVGIHYVDAAREAVAKIERGRD